LSHCSSGHHSRFVAVVLTTSAWPPRFSCPSAPPCYLFYLTENTDLRPAGERLRAARQARTGAAQVSCFLTCRRVVVASYLSVPQLLSCYPVLTPFLLALAGLRFPCPLPHVCLLTCDSADYRRRRSRSPCTSEKPPLSHSSNSLLLRVPHWAFVRTLLRSQTDDGQRPDACHGVHQVRSIQIES
jgi:hypothetical protein